MTETATQQTDSLPLAAGFTPEAWRNLCLELGAPPFRAKQLWNWIAYHLVDDWSRMSNIPGALRKQLAARSLITALKVSERTTAPDGVTKYLLACGDGELIESVLIPTQERHTLCVSTQAGCPFGCAFCASGAAGLVRNLAAGEIVEQVYTAARDIRIAPNAAPDARPDNIVFMGMGEPLANYDNTITAIRVLNEPGGLNIGARRITVSTCGVVPGIRKLSGEGLQIELSVSLHAPDDKLRNELMPVNNLWPLHELIEACADYTALTGRIITYEYTLIAGRNDQPHHADALTRLLRYQQCRINLIPLSPVPHFTGNAPTAANCARFQAILTRAGINTTLRNSRGSGADAACGQLRLRRRHS